MNTACAAVAAASALTNALVMSVPANAAPSPGCVTTAEWRKVNPHLGGNAPTRTAVYDVFDIDGVVTRKTTYEDGDGNIARVEWRKYDRCDTGKVYRIEFHQFNGGRYKPYWG